MEFGPVSLSATMSAISSTVSTQVGLDSVCLLGQRPPRVLGKLWIVYIHELVRLTGQVQYRLFYSMREERARKRFGADSS